MRGCCPTVFKYAFLCGVAAEWLLGPAADNLPMLSLSWLRALMYMLLAWMVIEGLHAIGKYITTFDDRISRR